MVFINLLKHFKKIIANIFRIYCNIKNIKLSRNVIANFFPHLYTTHVSISSHDRPRGVVARILNDVSTPFIIAKCHFNSVLMPRHAIFKLLYFYR